MADAQFGVLMHGRRWVKLADAPEPRSQGWSPIVWTANDCHAERWATSKGAEDFAEANLRGGWIIAPVRSGGSAFA